jgi:hypothetical protein
VVNLLLDRIVGCTSERVVPVKLMAVAYLSAVAAAVDVAAGRKEVAAT